MPNMVLRVSRLWWAGLLFMVPPPRHCGISAAPPPPPAPSHSSNPPVSLDSTAQGDCDPESWTIPTRALGLDTTEGRAEAVRRVAWSKAALEAAVTAGDPVVFKDVPLSHLNWTPERLATALPAVQCFVQPRSGPLSTPPLHPSPHSAAPVAAAPRRPRQFSCSCASVIYCACKSRRIPES